MSEIERELPSEQDKNGAKDGDVNLQSYEKAQELSQQFEDIQTATIGDNLLRGTVSAIESSPNNAAISVEVDLPAETDDIQFFLDKPKSWNREYDFVRWVEDHGYQAGDFEGMIEKGVRVEVRQEDDEYELVIPERVRDKTRKSKEKAKVLAKKMPEVLENKKEGFVTVSTIFGIFLGNLFTASLAFNGDILGFSIIATLLGSLGGLAAVTISAILVD